MMHADPWGFSEKPRKSPIGVPDDPGSVLEFQRFLQDDFLSLEFERGIRVISWHIC